MSQFNRFIDLNDLLIHCTDENSPHHQEAWVTFLETFREFLYLSIARNSARFNVGRVSMQINEAVNDILGEVLHILCKDDFKSMREFRERNSERTFKAWLAQICKYTTSRFIMRNFNNQELELDPGKHGQYIRALPLENRWLWYDDFVTELRSDKTKGNRERDIHLMMLYTWSDLDKDIILSEPCLRTLEGHLIDVVVNRLRSFFRKK